MQASLSLSSAQLTLKLCLSKTWENKQKLRFQQVYKNALNFHHQADEYVCNDAARKKMIDPGLYVIEILQANQILTIGYRISSVFCGKKRRVFFKNQARKINGGQVVWSLLAFECAIHKV